LGHTDILPHGGKRVGHADGGALRSDKLAQIRAIQAASAAGGPLSPALAEAEHAQAPARARSLTGKEITVDDLAECLGAVGLAGPGLD
jgi:hypothetical protein